MLWTSSSLFWLLCLSLFKSWKSKYTHGVTLPQWYLWDRGREQVFWFLWGKNTFNYARCTKESSAVWAGSRHHTGETQGWCPSTLLCVSKHTRLKSVKISDNIFVKVKTLQAGLFNCSWWGIEARAARKARAGRRAHSPLGAVVLGAPPSWRRQNTGPGALPGRHLGPGAKPPCGEGAGAAGRGFWVGSSASSAFIWNWESCKSFTKGRLSSLASALTDLVVLEYGLWPYPWVLW